MSNSLFPDLREIIDTAHPQDWIGVAGVCTVIEFTNDPVYSIKTKERTVDGFYYREKYTADGRYYRFSHSPVLRRANSTVKDSLKVQTAMPDDFSALIQIRSDYVPARKIVGLRAPDDGTFSVDYECGELTVAQFLDSREELDKIIRDYNRYHWYMRGNK